MVTVQAMAAPAVMLITSDCGGHTHHILEKERCDRLRKLLVPESHRQGCRLVTTLQRVPPLAIWHAPLHMQMRSPTQSAAPCAHTRIVRRAAREESHESLCGRATHHTMQAPYMRVLSPAVSTKEVATGMACRAAKSALARLTPCGKQKSAT